MGKCHLRDPRCDHPRGGVEFGIDDLALDCTMGGGALTGRRPIARDTVPS